MSMHNYHVYGADWSAYDESVDLPLLNLKSDHDVRRLFERRPLFLGFFHGSDLNKLFHGKDHCPEYYRERGYSCSMTGGSLCVRNGGMVESMRPESAEPASGLGFTVNPALIPRFWRGVDVSVSVAYSADGEAQTLYLAVQGEAMIVVACILGGEKDPCTHALTAADRKRAVSPLAELRDSRALSRKFACAEPTVTVEAEPVETAPVSRPVACKRVGKPTVRGARKTARKASHKAVTRVARKVARAKAEESHWTVVTVPSLITVKQIKALKGMRVKALRDGKHRKVGYVGREGDRTVLVWRQWYVDSTGDGERKSLLKSLKVE